MRPARYHAVTLLAVALSSAEAFPTITPTPYRPPEHGTPSANHRIESGTSEVRQDIIVVRAGETASSTITSGTQVTLPILVDPTQSGTNVASIDVRVTWATESVTYVSAVGGDFGSVTLNATEVANGMLRANSFAAQGTTNSFTLLNLTLQSGGAAGTTTVLVEVLAIGDELGQDLMSKVATVSHDLTIQGAGGLWGDSTQDRAVSVVDALACLTHVVGKALPTKFDATACDVVPDGPSGTFTGVVTSLDALAVLTYVVGLRLPSEFRVGVPR